MIKAVLFDMDGVLFDTEQIALDAGTAALEEMGYTGITKDFMLNLCGITEAAGAAVMQKKLGEGFDNMDYSPRMKQKMIKYMQENGVPTKPGLQEVLKYLKKGGYKFAIASSNGIDAIEWYLESTGFAGAFDVIVHGEMVENSKPHPEIFIRAAKALGFEPEQCVAVEDSRNGIISASDAGCVTVMIPDLIMPDAELERRSAAVLESLNELPAFLEKLVSG